MYIVQHTVICIKQAGAGLSRVNIAYTVVRTFKVHYFGFLLQYIAAKKQQSDSQPSSSLPRGFKYTASLLPTFCLVADSCCQDFCQSCWTSYFTPAFCQPFASLFEPSASFANFLPTFCQSLTILLPAFSSLLPSILQPLKPCYVARYLLAFFWLIPAFCPSSAPLLPVLWQPFASLLTAFHPPAASLLLTFYSPSGSLLPVFCQPSARLLPAFRLPAASLLPAFRKSFACLLPPCCQSSGSLLPVFCPPSASSLPALC